MKHAGWFLCCLLLLTACGSRGGSITYATPKPQQNSQVSYYGLEKTEPDHVAQRRIVLFHKESGEQIDVTYFNNGHYDAKALKKIDRLLRDRHVNVAGKIDPELIDYLVDIRTRFGLPSSVVFEISSGFRTRTTNARLARSNNNVALESWHMKGYAVDFKIQGVSGQAICEIAKTMQRGGVAFYPKNGHVHVDLGSIRTWRER